VLCKKQHKLLLDVAVAVEKSLLLGVATLPASTAIANLGFHSS